MRKPKILICVMSCNQDLYNQEEEIIKSTWLKDVNKYKNIDYIIFKSGNITEYKDNYLYLNVNDEFFYTYEKNIAMFEWVKENKKFDYLVRTNCSTFINVHLLNEYLTYIFNEYNNDNRIEVIETHWHKNTYMFSGKFFILKPQHVDYLLENRMYHNDLEDDIMFSKILSQNYNLTYEDKDKLSIYDYINFKQLPTKYINNVPSKIDNIDLRNLKEYSQIETCFACCCKPYASDNLSVIKESMFKLYELVNNNYSRKIDNCYKIYNFCNNNYSHNQTIQRMFIHKSSFCLVLDFEPDEKYIDYIFSNDNENFPNVKQIIILRDSVNKINDKRIKYVINEDFNDIYKTYREYFRFFIFIHKPVIVNKVILKISDDFVANYWDYHKHENMLIVRGNLIKNIDLYNLTQYKFLNTLK